MKGAGTVANPIAWGACEALSDAWVPPGAPASVTADQAARECARIAIEIAALDEMLFTLDDETHALIDLDEHAHAAGLQPFLLMDETKTRVHVREREWTRWTLVTFGGGPDGCAAEGEFAAALRDGEDDAHIIHQYRARGLPIYPPFAFNELQAMKRYTKWTPDALRNLDKESAEALNAFLNGLNDLYDHAAHVSGATPRIPNAASVNPLQQRLTFGARRDRLAPVFIPEGDDAFYSAEMLQWIRRQVGVFRNLPAGLRLEHQHGDLFEAFISLRFEELGFACGVAPHRFIGASLKKGSKHHEVDILAWNDRFLYFVEVKAKMENPGAWTKDARRERVDWLNKYWTALMNEKVPAWKKRIQERGPFYIDGTQHAVPASWASLEMKPVFISIRVEPAETVKGSKILTYMPARAVPVARRRVAPGNVAPFWDGTVPP